MHYLLILLLFITACATQNKARVELKGEQSYDWNNDLLNSNISENDLFSDNNTSNIVFAEPGDTLYSIASKHNVLYKDLAEANNLKWPYNLRTGQKLIIPKSNIHRVEEGETLLSIARKYNLSTEEIISMNDLNKPYILNPGQIIRVEKSKPVTISEYPTEENVSQSDIVSKPLPPLTNKAPSNNNELSVTASKDNENFIIPNSKNIVLDDQLPIKNPPEKSNQIKIINNKIKFNWPVNGNIISNFGPKVGGVKNDGINIEVKDGTAVKAAASGKVIYAGDDLSRYGNLIIIKHDQDWFTAYAHLKDILHQKGDLIKAAQTIGHVGKTGDVTTPQLHFAIRNGKTPVNPISFLPKKINH